MSELQTSFTHSTGYDHIHAIRQAASQLALTYNVGERQLYRAYRLACRQPGSPGHNLLVLLERRLENLIYRAGFAASLWEARALLTRHHAIVDGRCVSVASFRVRPGQIIEIRPRGSTQLMLLQSSAPRQAAPPYLDADQSRLTARLSRLPHRAEIPVSIDERLVEAYYTTTL